MGQQQHMLSTTMKRGIIKSNPPFHFVGFRTPPFVPPAVKVFFEVFRYIEVQRSKMHMFRPIPFILFIFFLIFQFSNMNQEYLIAENKMLKDAIVKLKQKIEVRNKEIVRLMFLHQSNVVDLTSDGEEESKEAEAATDFPPSPARKRARKDELDLFVEKFLENYN